ncbi:MAG TPA: M55 family metallopeptidase [Candidatus Dormibacteraeota bacterium]|nr:M55 family metallopeptidase [Candidatus Dormibacteraeota bacterium]
MAERSGVFISVDMEGMAGIVHLHQVMRGMPEYERSCRLMTAETNAAVAGARRAGATRIVVNDSHGDMRNFFLDELDDGVEVISGSDKPFSMGAGLDPSFEVAFFVGYHASVGSGQAIMDHTYGGRTIYALRINGTPQSEATLNAALAGTFGVRTALITGDRTTVEEAGAALPGIEGVIVKEALGRQAARSLHPIEACRRIEAGAYRAYQAREQRPLYQPSGPFTLEIDWMHAGMADFCVQIPGVQRAGGRTVRYESADFRTCYQMMLALLVMAIPVAYQYPRT